MRKKTMRKGIGKCLASRLAAGTLALALTACAIPAGTRVVYALEQAEADAAMESIIESETEAPEDAIITAVTHHAVDTLQTDETEMSPMVLLPEDMQQTLNSLDPDEIAEYAIMIERILKNPDFQSMMQYDEVRDLLVILIRNSLDMAAEEPELTSKVLETMGVNRNLILFFYAVLEASSNSEVPGEIQQFLLSDEGHELMGLISKTLDPETMKDLMNVYQEAMSTDSASGTAIESLPETETETGNK